MNRPNTCVNLIKAINRVAGPGRDALRLSRALANVIVAQMLPDGVVKGGSALMFRYGGNATRYTRDVDTARVMSLDAYLDKLEASLKTGWNGFTGRLQHVEPPHPEGIPQGYVMIPYDIKLAYNDRSWQTVRIEIGHNEIGDADEAELEDASDQATLLEQLGFPRPRPIPVMKLPYQIAQKLHAVSTEGADRPHDLVDLQLICGHSNIDLAAAKAICVRLFDYRRRQPWPPTVAKGNGWDSLYEWCSFAATLRPFEGIRRVRRQIRGSRRRRAILSSWSAAIQRSPRESWNCWRRTVRRGRRRFASPSAFAAASISIAITFPRCWRGALLPEPIPIIRSRPNRGIA